MKTMLDSKKQSELMITHLDTQAERATHAVHRDILTGNLTPDSKLRILDLSKHYGMGATPIREALSRLSTRGLVIATANRGFRVRPTSREDLEDIVKTRLVVEVEALKLSMARGDDEWEASILAAFHRMKKIAVGDPEAFREGAFEFDQAHKRFHTALIAACGMPRLIDIHEMLYDQTYRYRSLAFHNITKMPRFLANHAALADDVIHRRERPACEEIRWQIESTLQILYLGGKKPRSGKAQRRKSSR